MNTYAVFTHPAVCIAFHILNRSVHLDLAAVEINATADHWLVCTAADVGAGINCDSAALHPDGARRA